MEKHTVKTEGTYCWGKTILKGCCCTCSHQLKLMCHPWNHPFGKGDVTEQCGWACNVGSDSSITFMDSQHGYCEMYASK